jgi:hypothetical protein
MKIGIVRAASIQGSASESVGIIRCGRALVVSITVRSRFTAHVSPSYPFLHVNLFGSASNFCLLNTPYYVTGLNTPF